MGGALGTVAVALAISVFLLGPVFGAHLGVVADARFVLLLRAVVPAGVLGWFLVPALLAEVAYGGKGRGVLVFVLAALGALYVVCDATLYGTFGRHLSGLWRYARLPDGAAAAGAKGTAALRFLVAFGWSLLGGALFVLSARAGERAHAWLTERSARLLAGTVLGALLLAAIVLFSAPHVLAPLAPEGVGERLYAALPVEVRRGDVAAVSRSRSPGMQALAERLGAEYRALFAYAHAPPGEMQLDFASDGGAPSVSLVVAESLRWEQLGGELMPRLSELAKQGLRFERHYAGTNHSEAGLFTLLYAQGAFNYEGTLDARRAPTTFGLLGRRGYQFGYFTGHPEKWLRRDEFLNARTLDRYQRDDRGGWNEWDERALGRAAAWLRERETRYALTFLMSSHYEYRYPPRARVDVPDEAPAYLWAPGEIQPSEVAACRNRYRNVARYLDEVVSAHVRELDLSRTWFVFTGDHGEATGEDGRFGHGFDFSDPLTRVPFFILGPGIPSGVVDDVTLHQDLLPTLATLLGAKWPEGTLGRPLVEKEANGAAGGWVPRRAAPRGSLFQCYSEAGTGRIFAQLRVGERRLEIRMEARRPRLEVLGFRDARGHAVSLEPDGHTVDAFVELFRRELERGVQALPR